MGSERSRTPWRRRSHSRWLRQPTIGHSPAPTEGKSLRSTSTVEDRHVAEARDLVFGHASVRMRPFQLDGFEQRPAQSIMFEPSIWLRRLSGLTMAPQSKASPRARPLLRPSFDSPRLQQRSRCIQLLVPAAHPEALAGSFPASPANFLAPASKTAADGRS